MTTHSSCFASLLATVIFGALSGFGPTAKAAGAPAIPEVEPVIQLPALTVEAKHSIRWTYYEEGRLRVLSQCPDEVTKQWILDYIRMYALLDLIFPPDLQPKFDAPERVLLYPPEDDSGAANRAARALTEEVAALSPTGSQTRRGAVVEFMPNIMMRDWDCYILAAQVNPGGRGVAGSIVPSNVGRRQSMFSPPMNGPKSQSYQVTDSHFRALLLGRRPLLPGWFVLGLSQLFNDMEFNLEAVDIAQLPWGEPEEAKLQRDHPETLRLLSSLEEVFALSAGAGPAPGDRRVREAALFVRWCLDDSTHARTTALWRFAAAGCSQPISEELFVHCFGLDYPEALEAIDAYVGRAVRHDFQLTPKSIPKPDVKLRLASKAEIAEIRGGWERLELNFVRERLPALAHNYAEQAGLTLQRAYDSGIRTPELLAEDGLLNLETGNKSAAFALLESAAQAHVVRPRVYCELARLILEKVANPDASDDASQREKDEARVEQLLDYARTMTPIPREAFLLTCAALSQRATILAPNEVEILNEGLGLFPDSFELTYKTAILELRSRLPVEARRVLTNAAARVVTDQQRKLLNGLLQQCSELESRKKTD
jgi:hypothetical protein